MSDAAGIASVRYSSDRPAEVLRWVICFAIVAGAHGAVALSLLKSDAERSDSGIDVPIVMLDLPEALVPSIAPVRDLPPGPMEQQEVEAAPPPKEETKRPEPEAEVALPKPEPPKPEPPPEAKQAAAPQAARTPPQSVVRWQGRLAAHIERFKRYPAEARSHSVTGTVIVSYTIDREGHLLRSSIVQSSGSAALDQEALAMLVRAQPMPRPPEELSSNEVICVMHVGFNLR
jgi:periplasmic protein TonB